MYINIVKNTVPYIFAKKLHYHRLVIKLWLSISGSVHKPRPDKYLWGAKKNSQNNGQLVGPKLLPTSEHHRDNKNVHQ
jgi:hypothetical protein